MARLYHTIFNLLALSAVIYIGTDAFYRIVRAQLRQLNTVKIVTQSMPDIKRRLSPPLGDFRMITDRALFGSIDKATKDVIPTRIETLEPTSLKVALLGTVMGHLQSSVAVIEDTRKREQGLYRVGDSIQNAVVKVILRGKVILRVGDKDEILTMEESAETRSESEKKEKVARPRQRERTITIRRADVENALKDVNSLLSQARIHPRFKDGQADGIVITGIRPGSIFRKMGLRNGDIVSGINNNAITTPDEVLAMYSDLKSGSSFSLQIRRRNQPRTLNLRFR